MSKKSKFIECVEEALFSKIDLNDLDPDVVDYWNALKGTTDIEKPMFTDNGKLIVNPLVRDDGVTPYDAMFCSDQRFYDYYKLPANSLKGEAPRNTVTSGGLILNTPIVIYSWASITEALVTQNIVEEVDGTYYIKTIF